MDIKMVTKDIYIYNGHHLVHLLMSLNTLY
jgi:hypothetical protein